MRTDGRGSEASGASWPGLGMRNSVESRITVLGHVQRGGSPVAYDRVLATRLGIAAIEEAAHGEWGNMVGMVGRKIVTTSWPRWAPHLARCPTNSGTCRRCAAIEGRVPRGAGRLS